MSHQHSTPTDDHDTACLWGVVLHVRAHTLLSLTRRRPAPLGSRLALCGSCVGRQLRAARKKVPPCHHSTIHTYTLP